MKLHPKFTATLVAFSIALSFALPSKAEESTTKKEKPEDLLTQLSKFGSSSASTAFYLSGSTHMIAGKYLQALSDFTKSIELDPTSSVRL